MDRNVASGLQDSQEFFDHRCVACHLVIYAIPQTKLPIYIIEHDVRFVWFGNIDRRGFELYVYASIDAARAPSFGRIALCGLLLQYSEYEQKSRSRSFTFTVNVEFQRKDIAVKHIADVADIAQGIIELQIFNAKSNANIGLQSEYF